MKYDIYGLSERLTMNKITNSVFQASALWVLDNVVEEKDSKKLIIPSRPNFEFNGIINVAWNVKMAYPLYMPVLELGVDDHDVVDPEIYNLAAHFHKIFKPTLVHCNAGLNRSTAFAACLIISEGYGYEKALELAQNAAQWEITKELKLSLQQWCRLRRQNSSSS